MYINFVVILMARRACLPFFRSIINALIKITTSFSLVLLLSIGILSPAYALNTTFVQNPVTFSCNELYVGSPGVGGSGSGVSRLDVNTAKATKLYYPASTIGYSGYPTATIALGHIAGGNTGPLTMYHWTYSAGWQLIQFTEGNSEIINSPYNMPAPGTSALNYWSGGEVVVPPEFSLTT